MSRHTSWKTGGMVDFYYRPDSVEDLIRFMESVPDTMPITWIGNGSNLLIRDGGIRGVVISAARIMNQLEIRDPCHISCGAGTYCAKLARFAADNHLSGVEFLIGIPGTVGGALAMNAGAYGQEIWQVVVSASLLDRKGQSVERPRADFDVFYRDVDLGDGQWFTSCTLKLVPSTKEKCDQRIRHYLSERAERQPIEKLSCGSVFKNPDQDYAARLISLCGLKGLCIGGACVSEKHANFIINKGTATARDIEQLIELVRDKVLQQFGIKLETEVKILGTAA